MTEQKINQSSKRQMINFFLKLFILVLIVFLLDFSIGKVLKYYYFKQESGLLYRTTYSLEKTTADVLVFGSSRANHHYDADVFEKDMQLSYYNVGRDGSFIFYHYAVLKSVLKRYTPKVVILDFLTGEFGISQDAYDRMTALLPYYKTHPEIRPIVNLKSEFEKYKQVSNIYPYNSLLFTISAGNSEFNKTRVADIKGYVPLTRVWDAPAKAIDFSTKYELDSNKINMFNNFVKDCIAANVKLYVVSSPILQKSAVADYSVNIAKDIAAKNSIPFFDFLQDTTYSNHPELFADVYHLNDKGAKLFSGRLIDTIKRANFATIAKH